jgi:hypothetical protein
MTLFIFFPNLKKTYRLTAAFTFQINEKGEGGESECDLHLRPKKWYNPN